MAVVCTAAPGVQCPCVKVAPDGDDAAAVASHGLAPFADVQAAIDFASLNPNVAVNVCVAAGASCGGFGGYSGPNDADLEMRNGVGVYGRYESSDWTRCPDSETRLRPTTRLGVLFGPSIDSETRLDGFTIVRLPEETTAAVTIGGARGARLVEVSVITTSYADIPTFAYGVDAFGGAEVSIEQSSIVSSGGEGDFPNNESMALRSIGSQVVVRGSLLQADGVGIVSAAWLQDSPDSLIEDSTLLAEGSTNLSDAQGGNFVSGARVTGDTGGILIEGNDVVASRGLAGTNAIVLEACDAGVVSIAGNATIEAELGGGTSTVEALLVGAGCSTEITGNSLHAAVLDGSGAITTTSAGIRCAAGSRCRVRNNDVSVGNGRRGPGDLGTSRGISCEGGSCSEVVGNTVTGLAGYLGCYRSCVHASFGLVVQGGPEPVLVARNHADGGCGADTAVGAWISGETVRVENNHFVGRSRSCDGGVPQISLDATGVRISGSDVDVHSNTIDGGGSREIEGACTVIAADASSGAFRNNIFMVHDCGGGGQSKRLPFFARGAGPALLENNNLYPSLSGDPLYEQAGIQLLTIAEVNALAGATNNFTGDCAAASSPCINAGTRTGAPALDLEGKARDFLPDVGALETVWPACGGVSCSGLGACVDFGAGIECDCQEGYTQPVGDPLSCIDADECAVDNGGCDPLTTCTNVEGGRSCGPCPPGYAGTGELQCALYGPLGLGEVHSCAIRADLDVICWGDDFYGQLDAPSGPLAAVNAGRGHNCGLRLNGTAVCWGNLVAPPAGSFEFVDSSWSNACGIRSDGSIECWGFNASGQSSPPSGVYTTLAGGGNHLCAIAADETLACWGANGSGQATPPAGSFLAVTAGRLHSCAIRADDTVTCWGSNGDGRSTPPSGPFVAVAAGGGDHTCGIRPGGAVECWGSNDFGQSSPPAGTFTHVACGEVHSCGLRSDGTIACWGSNDFGISTPP